MSIGDITSTEKGSGARFNDGKPPLDLLPLRVLLDTMEARSRQRLMVYALSMFQERDATAAFVLRFATLDDKILAARVFEYGRRKYAAWNWAKGMPWSVPIACAARHLVAIERGEENDPESGLSHWGHFWCNVIMLATFKRTYPEGDDRPPKGLLAPEVA